jgi:hypothetical protein
MGIIMGSRLDHLLNMGGPGRPEWPYAPGTPKNMETVMAEVQELYHLWRMRACWWMRQDLRVETPGQALSVLKAIRDQADKYTWIRCMELMKWLSPRTSATS